MSEPRAYLDWNAGAPPRRAVLARMVEAMDRVGNASSVHAEGRARRAAIETARRQVAALVGAPAKGVTFTSGGTEAAVTVLTPHWTEMGRPIRFDRLLVSAVEHPCVARGGRFPAEAVETIPADADGVVDLGWLARRLEVATTAGERCLVSVMLANNETGAIQPVAKVAGIAHAHGALVMSDAVQAAGRIAVDIAALGVDVVTLSAHKIGGPQGIGAVVRASDRFSFAPLVTGGGQESWARAGTENVPAIEGFGVAAEAARDDLAAMDAVRSRRDRVEALVRAAMPDAAVFGAGAERLANTAAFALPGIAAETALIGFDLAGIALSSGSACSSGKVAASAALLAMGVAEDLARSALRVSIGTATTDEEIERFGAALVKVVAAAKRRERTKAA